MLKLKVRNLTLWCAPFNLLLSKIYKAWATKIQRSYFSWQWTVMETVIKKTDMWLEKWHKKFCQFSCDQEKVWQLALWWVPAENVQKSYFTETLRVMQSLKKNWPVILNMKLGILWIFTQPLTHPKILIRWAIFVLSIWSLS